MFEKCESETKNEERVKKDENEKNVRNLLKVKQKHFDGIDVVSIVKFEQISHIVLLFP